MSESACISLAERFGRRFRLSWEANGATKTQWTPEDRPWLLEIRGRHGVVYPKNGEILQAMSYRPRIARQLRALPCVLTARGDVETVVTFHVVDAEAVFALLKPYRRRQVAEAQRQRLATVGKRFRFSGQHGVESAFPALESTNAAPDGRQAE